MTTRYSDCFPKHITSTPQHLFFHKVFNHPSLTNCFLDLKTLNIDFSLPKQEITILELFHKEMFPVNYQKSYYQRIQSGKYQIILLKANLLLFFQNNIRKDADKICKMSNKSTDKEGILKNNK